MFFGSALEVGHLSPLADLERVLWHNEGPPYGPGAYLMWALYGAARGEGVRVVLDGHGGDETVSYGTGYLAELAVAGRWLALASELRGAARTGGGYPWRLDGARLDDDAIGVSHVAAGLGGPAARSAAVGMTRRPGRPPRTPAAHQAR